MWSGFCAFHHFLVYLAGDNLLGALKSFSTPSQAISLTQNILHSRTAFQISTCTKQRQLITTVIVLQ